MTNRVMGRPVIKISYGFLISLQLSYKLVFTLPYIITLISTEYFYVKDAANLVVKKRNLKLRDRDLRLYHAKPSSTTPSKRRNPTPAEADISPAKKLATGSRISLESSNRLKTKSVISYQGLQASKSGVPKKGRLQTKEAVKFKSKNQKENTLKEQQKKRPAVAARKAKINSVKAAAGGGGSKQTGKKRKLESQTPEGGRRSKKAKKFR